ncbi:MAG: type II secretion system protein [Candidatus Omnitrophica bacterium]|nr:type II secretion system protein [Candidatus Omnitrophota bacterium]
MKGERGFLLISLYMVVVILVILGGTLVAQALTEVRAAQRSQASTQALYLAEAGIDQAIGQLRQDFNWATGYNSVPLGTTGAYTVSLQAVGADKRITSSGESRLFATPVNRSLEVFVRKSIPPNFYDNAIWASRDLDFRGNTYSVVGDVRHGDTIPTGNMNNVSGTITYDAATNPLPRLSFQQLFNIAQAQGNVYDAERLANGHNVFPASFWYTPPTDPNDPLTGVPNVNYVTTDLVLNGDIGTIGGFFVVVGNVLTDPSTTENSTINGNGLIEGAIYTTGNFEVNGGGNGLNVNGGVWAGSEARLQGATTIQYNFDYMNAIRALGINADVQVVSWTELD